MSSESKISSKAKIDYIFSENKKKRKNLIKKKLVIDATYNDLTTELIDRVNSLNDDSPILNKVIINLWNTKNNMVHSLYIMLTNHNIKEEWSLCKEAKYTDKVHELSIKQIIDCILMRCDNFVYRITRKIYDLDNIDMTQANYNFKKLTAKQSVSFQWFIETFKSIRELRKEIEYIF